MTISEGPPLVPLERVALPTDESTDKATRRMITQINTTLTPRFSLKPNGEAVDYRSVRFAQLADDSGRVRLKAALRVTSGDYLIAPNQPVKTISGMCLFGAAGLIGIGESGRKYSLTDPMALKQEGVPEKIREIVETPFLHPSETETILQVTGALKLLAGEGVDCFFHLPKTEYKLYMLEPFQQGKLTAEQLKILFAKIDRRSVDLTRLVLKRMPVPTEVGSPLAPLEDLLGSQQGNAGLAECLDRAGQDPLLAALIKTNRPASFLDLCDVSYVAGYLKQALAAADQGAGCLAVDMAQEIKIFDYAKEAARALGLDLSMAVMLLAPAVVTKNGLHGKDSLFMSLPNGLTPLSENKIVFRAVKGGKE